MYNNLGMLLDQQGKKGEAARQFREVIALQEDIGLDILVDGEMARGDMVVERGKIRARRVSGNCSQHQRDVATAVKNAREMALLPYSAR